MTDELFTYDVRCRTCRKSFQVQLYENHEKNLFVAAKKDWYCETCKKKYFKKQTEELSKAHQDIGFGEMEGSAKMISWAVKIRAELINKLEYLKKSLTFENNDEKDVSEKAFAGLLDEWRKETEAKWWIDNRTMTVRDMSNKIAKLSEQIKSR